MTWWWLPYLQALSPGVWRILCLESYFMWKKEQLLMINVPLVGQWLASSSWDHLIGSDTFELERDVYLQGPQQFLMKTSYVFFCQIFIEGPLRQGDSEKLGKQVGIVAREWEWTTQKESVIWESEAFHGPPPLTCTLLFPFTCSPTSIWPRPVLSVETSPFPASAL